MRLRQDQQCLHCDYCGNIFYPDRNEDGVRVLGQPSGRPCPVCATGLEQATLDEHPVAYCARCKGMLVDMSIFVDVIELMRSRRGEPGAALKPADPRQLQRRLECPKCHRPMDTHFYGGPGNVVIDDCSRCQLNWLDYGEMARIASAPDRTYSEAVTTF